MIRQHLNVKGKYRLNGSIQASSSSTTGKPFSTTFSHLSWQRFMPIEGIVLELQLLSFILSLASDMRIIQINLSRLLSPTSD